MMMKCPECGSGNWRVIDTRVTQGGRRRRKACNDCGARWTTIEIPQADLNDIQQQVRGLEDKLERLFAFCSSLNER